VVLKVGPPSIDAPRDEVAWMRPGAVYLGSLMPLRHLRAAQALARRGVTAFATDAIPRTTRAQSMDTLSSMANIAGYKGVLLAAAELNKYFPMFMTAAGMVPPAKVFVIGAGVAGLQAIATAKRLGANVTGTDVRPEVKEQLPRLLDVFKRHPGGTAISLTFRTESALEADTTPLPNLTVTASEHFIADVEEVLGKGALSLVS